MSEGILHNVESLHNIPGTQLVSAEVVGTVTTAYHAANALYHLSTGNFDQASNDFLATSVSAANVATGGYLGAAIAGHDATIMVAHLAGYANNQQQLEPALSQRIQDMSGKIADSVFYYFHPEVEQGHPLGHSVDQVLTTLPPELHKVIVENIHAIHQQVSHDSASQALDAHGGGSHDHNHTSHDTHHTGGSAAEVAAALHAALGGAPAVEYLHGGGNYVVHGQTIVDVGSTVHDPHQAAPAPHADTVHGGGEHL